MCFPDPANVIEPSPSPVSITSIHGVIVRGCTSIIIEALVPHFLDPSLLPLD